MIYAKRNTALIKTLNPKGQAMANQWLGKLETAKREVLITSGTRTSKEQDALWDIGRNVLGKIVTNNKGGTSKHNFGLALDFCPCDKNGLLLWTDLKKFRTYAAVAKMCGFEWGGDWKSFKDSAHLQFKV